MHDHLEILYIEIFRPLFIKMAGLPSIRQQGAEYSEKEWEIMEGWLKNEEVYAYLNEKLHIAELSMFNGQKAECKGIGRCSQENAKFKAALDEFRRRNKHKDIVWHLSSSGMGISGEHREQHRLTEALYVHFDNLLKDLEFNGEEKKLFECKGEFCFNLLNDTDCIYQHEPAFEFDMDAIACEFEWEKCSEPLKELQKIWYKNAETSSDKAEEKTCSKKEKKQFDSEVNINKLVKTSWILISLLPVLTPTGDLKSWQEWEDEREKLREILFRYFNKQMSFNRVDNCQLQEEELTIRFKLLQRLFDKYRYTETQREFLYEYYYYRMKIPAYKNELENFIKQLDWFDEEVPNWNLYTKYKNTVWEYQICKSIWNYYWHQI